MIMEEDIALVIDSFEIKHRECLEKIRDFRKKGIDVLFFEIAAKTIKPQIEYLKYSENKKDIKKTAEDLDRLLVSLNECLKKEGENETA